MPKVQSMGGCGERKRQGVVGCVGGRGGRERWRPCCFMPAPCTPTRPVGCAPATLCDGALLIARLWALLLAGRVKHVLAELGVHAEELRAHNAAVRVAAFLPGWEVAALAHKDGLAAARLLALPHLVEFIVVLKDPHKSRFFQACKEEINIITIDGPTIHGVAAGDIAAYPGLSVLQVFKHVEHLVAPILKEDAHRLRAPQPARLVHPAVHSPCGQLVQHLRVHTLVSARHNLFQLCVPAFGDVGFFGRGSDSALAIHALVLGLCIVISKARQQQQQKHCHHIQRMCVHVALCVCV
mmetsp:Transcript_4690/g.11655  ORF Transcript_4690/g.11655 Transcript_4690/m.11655 type:complete len:296 (+) Transcript_4690:89-976(+)|eukprot:CAMPEP_0177657340 /NCGR_PEP_ID=MMETSP0447-20121125/16127_1 /TAXON_ID=0 /ORGANISM="Stygamoeba regulata, Strain BSH-02190019" /LENGTH=295 /DNA_ID=CAMNT_0019161677 /DNA_START=86 /DNA_END=973 /DNA_ORIENTATION=+